MRGMLKKISGKRLVAAILIITAVFGCVSCKKKKKNELTPEEIAGFEHTFSNIIPSDSGDPDEVVVDEQGFILTDDYVYIKNDQANIKASQSEDSETVVTLNYGTKMYRTGYKEDGWNRVNYEGKSVYINSDQITELTINTEEEFEYSIAALNIVETQRQFYSYEDMCGDLNQIKKEFDEVVTLNAIGLTEDNRTVFEIVIGNPEAENSILIIAGMEACEYMTCLFSMKLAEYYAHYAEEGLYKGYSYSELLDNCAIHIVPMLNPDGVAISQYYLEAVNSQVIGDNINSWFERDQSQGGTSLSLENYLMFFYGNAKGVDLTYNFPYHWDEVGGVSAPASKDYKGVSAGSENEVQNVMWLIDEINPSAVINLRTSGNCISYDFGLADEVYKRSYLYADLMSKMFVYTRDDSAYGKSYYGSLEGYAACVKNLPALRINIGSGDAPLSLNEYNSIWNSGRESLAALMAEIING